MFAVLDLAADLEVVKFLFPIEDVDVTVTTATALVELSLPEDARVDGEVTFNTFDLDETFAWRFDLLYLMPLAKLYNLTFKITFLTFL